MGRWANLDGDDDGDGGDDGGDGDVLDAEKMKRHRPELLPRVPLVAALVVAHSGASLRLDE